MDFILIAVELPRQNTVHTGMDALPTLYFCSKSEFHNRQHSLEIQHRRGARVHMTELDSLELGACKVHLKGTVKHWVMSDLPL